MEKNLFDYFSAGEMPREIQGNVERFGTFLTFLISSPHFKKYSEDLTLVDEAGHFFLPSVLKSRSAITPVDVRAAIKNQNHLDYLLRSMVDVLIRGEDSYESVFAAMFDYYYTVRNYSLDIRLDIVH
ncbi:hypothetical protein PHOBOS_6 [Erwinia phage vB_EamM_Phobos]|uniref:hypothetical protein n=1 Tax=Erwinia phage vB_EamM_Phobos TaxID=1883377 RepID=UPI00081CDF9C|nr:hypothetical protein BIZ79_gp006 [Erwinia phage vB_EamM_Phobos]ANZ50196.1 hypothetical protein PHOBOS_6 [Erwinia phage vB_EamM_Phobos]